VKGTGTEWTSVTGSYDGTGIAPRSFLLEAPDSCASWVPPPLGEGDSRSGAEEMRGHLAISLGPASQPLSWLPLDSSLP
jgi:hypothetical protein